MLIILQNFQCPQRNTKKVIIRSGDTLCTLLWEKIQVDNTTYMYMNYKIY